jgi:predicted nucleic acid-binding protein
MMNSLFIDTSGWASLFVTREPHHLQSRQHFTQATQQNQTIITSNYIISELVALLQALDSPATPMTGDDWSYIRAQVRQNLSQPNPHA